MSWRILLDFPGCVVVVSHDRYFMDKIVDHLFVFEGQGAVSDFPGNYSDYREYAAVKPSEEISTTEKPKENSWRDDSTGTKLSYKEQKEFGKLEKEITQLEKKKDQLQQDLKELSAEEIKDKSVELQNMQDEIEEKTMRYFELMEMES